MRTLILSLVTALFVTGCATNVYDLRTDYPRTPFTLSGAPVMVGPFPVEGGRRVKIHVATSPDIEINPVIDGKTTGWFRIGTEDHVTILNTPGVHQISYLLRPHQSRDAHGWIEVESSL